jgi:predicted nucleotidyltransferase
VQTRSSSSVRVFYPKFSREEIIRRITRGLGHLGKELSLSLVVLFGSYARGDHTVASDVDLLVVYNGEARRDAYAFVKRTLDLPRLEPHVYSESEYQEMRETVEAMIRGGVTLYRGGAQGEAPL